MQARRPGPATGGRARWGLAPTRVFAGRIVSVDADAWSCVVVSEIGMKRFHDIDLGSSYLHPFDGEGIHVMPEPGAPVWVCISSEGDAPGFVLRYRGYPARAVTDGSNENKPHFRTNRPRMALGDISLTTRDRNGLRIRRGRLTEIFGSPLARTAYMGSTGTIHTVAKNLQLDTFGGSMRWKVERAEKDPDGHQAVALDMKVKEYADDQAHVVQLESGAQLESPTEGGSDPDTGGVHSASPHAADLVTSPVLRLRIFEDGDVEELSLAEVISLLLDKTGNIELSGAGTILARTGSTVTITKSGSGEEKVVLGETFITDLLESMTEIYAILTALTGASATAKTAEFLTKLTTSLAAGAPHLSNVTRTE